MKRKVTEEEIDITDISGEKKTLTLTFNNCTMSTINKEGSMDELSLSSLIGNHQQKNMENSITISEYKKEIVSLKNKNRRLSESNSVLFMTTMIFASLFVVALMKVWQVVE